MAIKFDITGDNQNFLSSMGQVQSEIQRTKQLAEKMEFFKGWREGFNGFLKDFKDFGGSLEEQKQHLTNVVEGLSGTMSSKLQDISAWQQQLTRALEKGDTAVADNLSKAINKTIAEIGRLASEVEGAQRLLDMLRGSTGVELPPVVFSEEELNRVRQLRQEIADLKAQAVENESAGDFSYGQKQRADAAILEKELEDLRQKGIETAEALGPEMATKLQYAQESIADLTDKAEALKNETEELATRTEQAWSDFLRESEAVQAQLDAGESLDSIDTSALEAARQKWEGLNEETRQHQANLIKTNAELQSMQALEENLGKQMGGGEKQDSLRVRLRKAREEMELLIEEGKFMSPEFIKAAQEAGRRRRSEGAGSGQFRDTGTCAGEDTSQSGAASERCHTV